MSFIDLLGKEFLNLRKNIGVIVILFVVPVFIILIMGFAFQDREVKYNLGFVNYDGETQLTTGLLNSLKDVDALNVKEYKDEKDAGEELKKEKVTGYLVIPKGFDGQHERGDAEVKLVLDNSKSINSSVIEGITGRFIEKFNTRVMGVMATSYTFDELYPNDDPEKVVDVARDYVRKVTKDPIEIKKELVVPTQKGSRMSSFNQTTCGMTAMFILFLCILWGSTNILEEKLSGTLTRLALSPVSLFTILSTKLTYIGLLSTLQFVLFFGIGHFALQVPVGNVFLLVLLNLVFILQAASLGLLISIVAKTRISAIGLSFFVIMLLSPLGGLWFPLEQVPKALQTVASFMPTGAFMIGIEKIIIKNSDFFSIVNQMLVIIVFFLVSFIASIKIGVLRRASN
jgi:ABC-2 type transport system permease protein